MLNEEIEIVQQIAKNHADRAVRDLDIEGIKEELSGLSKVDGRIDGLDTLVESLAKRIDAIEKAIADTKDPVSTNRPYQS